MRARYAAVVTLSLSLAGSACADREGGDPAAVDDPARGTPATASPDRESGRADTRRYAIGRAPTRAELRALDRDIGSDGAELPPGRGTVAEGRVLYAAQCAMCHGVKGEGIAPAFPALTGRDPRAEGFVFASDPKLVHTIGNYWPHATTLFDYIRRAVPLTAPGSLTDDQVYALSAYLLAADDIIPDTTTLDAARLRAVRMPYRDRFIPDDRRPTQETR
jgi:mono/diheme cytochrome c family protein